MPTIRSTNPQAAEKAERVLRVLAGESAATVARDAGVAVEALLDWKRAFVRAGVRALEAATGGHATAANRPLLSDEVIDELSQLDWRLEEERLGNMVTALGTMIPGPKIPPPPR